MPKLLVIDFDETIITPHTFRLIEWELRSKLATELGKNPSQISDAELNTATGEFIRKGLEDGSLRINNYDQLRSLIINSIGHGDEVAICSFTKFPAAIQTALEYLKLPPVYMAKIITETAFPDQNQQAEHGKNNHIAKALFKAQTTNTIGAIVLIDDDSNNIKKIDELEKILKERGIACKGIQVPKPAQGNVAYIEQAIDAMGLREYVVAKQIIRDAVEYIGRNITIPEFSDLGDVAKSWLIRLDNFSTSYAQKKSEAELKELETAIRDLLPPDKQPGVVARPSSRQTPEEKAAGIVNWTLNINRDSLLALAALNEEDLKKSSSPKPPGLYGA